MTILEEHQWEVESWVKSCEVEGVSFPCPLNACGAAPSIPWPKAGPLLRACSSLWRSKLFPSAQPKWLQLARDFTKEKRSGFANSTATSSPPHRHGEEHQSASPLAAPPFLSTGPSSDSCPIILTPQGSRVRDCSCWWQHPSLLKHDFLVLLMHHFLLLPSQP